jgi:glycosyltransferase involved in cell wall biosynthesis
MSNLDVQVSLLGDNANAAPGPLAAQPPAPIRFYAMFRPVGRFVPRALSTLGLGRVTRMTARLLAERGVPMPLGQRMRYVDRAANYDLFLRQSQPELLHVAHAEFRQYLSQRVAGAKVPVVASVLSATVLLRSTPDWLVKMAIQNYNLATRLIACSSFVRDMIVPHMTDPNSVVMIPNGVDTERFQPGSKSEARTALGLSAREFVVLYTGGLVMHKGVDTLLKAFARDIGELGNARLVYVGAGPEAQSLETMAGALGVRRQVTLAGYRPVQELPDWYQACDVFVLPSQSEGLSISLLEAMASGRPVITTPPDFGDHDAVEHGVNGFLCPFGSVDALAAALSVLSRSPQAGREAGIAARSKAERHFAWPVIAKQVKGIYREVLAETGKAA